MTDQRKDEMPEDIFADTDETGFNNWDTHLKYVTKYIRADPSTPVQDEMPEAIKFVERGCYMAYDMDIELNKRRLQTVLRAAHAPPMPDDVAEALHCAGKAFDGYRFTSQDANKYMDALIAALRAASTPDAGLVDIKHQISKLQAVKDYLYNPFEPDNQARQYRMLSEVIEALASLDAVLEGE